MLAGASVSVPMSAVTFVSAPQTRPSRRLVREGLDFSVRRVATNEFSGPLHGPTNSGTRSSSVSSKGKRRLSRACPLLTARPRQETSATPRGFAA